VYNEHPLPVIEWMVTMEELVDSQSMLANDQTGKYYISRRRIDLEVTM